MRSTLGRSVLPVIMGAVGVIAGTARAVPITTLYSTGVDAYGMPLSGGAVDPHWRLVSSPDPAFPGPDARVIHSNSHVFGGFVPNTLTSRWIAPRPDGGHNFPRSDCTSGCYNGDYHYETMFDLTGIALDTVEIFGQWAADDSAVMLLNGASTGVSRPFVQGLNWSTWASFTINSGFVAGLNTLTVIVNNRFFPNSNLRDNPTGLHVQLAGTGVLLPEPASLVLLIVSSVALRKPRRSVAAV